MDSKKASVVIPSFNCAAYIEDAVRSVFAQTYAHIEVIVIDDGSTDDTGAALRTFAADPRFRFVRQERKGPAAARNRGIGEATGEYVAFLDADDTWKPEKLKRSIGFLEQRKFDWICTAMLKIRQNGERIIKRIPDSSWVIDPESREIRQLKRGLFFFSSIPVHTPTIVARSSCFKRAGTFDEGFLVGEDTDLWLRFEEAGLRGGYLDEPLTHYRYNEKSVTRGRNVDGLREHIRVARKHAVLLGWNQTKIRKSYAGFLWDTADSYYSRGRYAKAALCVAEGISRDPGLARRLLARLLRIRRKTGKKKINVLYYDPSSGFGGSTRCLATWLEKLHRNSFNPSVCVHYNGPAMARMKELGVKVSAIPARSILAYSPGSTEKLPLVVSYGLFALDFVFFALPAAVWMGLIMIFRNIDIVHLNAKISVVIPGILAARFLHIPSVCHIHDTKVPVRKEKFFARWTDCCIVLTEKARELYAREYPGTRLTLIENGIDVRFRADTAESAKLRRELKIGEKDRVVGIVGRLVEGKGFEDFLYAAERILATQRDVTFLIVGSSPMEGKAHESFLRRLAGELGVGGKVLFTGWRDDPLAVMALFDVAVQASSTFPEGFGMTVIEAMALRKPVVATDIPGPSEIVVDGDTGFIVPPASPEKLAAAVDKLLSDGALARRMGENGYRRVRERFNLDRTVRLIEETYLSLLGYAGELQPAKGRL